MTKKTLPTDAVIDDLAGSPFFKPRQNTNKITDDIAASPDRLVVISPPRRIASKRTIVRRGFDYYEDQLASLKKLSLQEQLDGRGDGSMSRMLREALDEYLKKRQ